jgi:hypothetical protein
VPPRTSITFGVIFSDQYDLSVLKGPENGTKEVRLLNDIYIATGISNTKKLTYTVEI